MNIHFIIQTIKDTPRNIKYGILNLIKWFPVIWQDRDWDHYYLYVILQHKLKHMEHLHIHYSHLMSGSQTAKEIKTCLILLERLMEDEYHENASIEYHKKWGRPKFNWTKLPDDERNYSELEITHKYVKTKKDESQNIKDFHRTCDHERNMRKQDIEYLFKYMEKHIEGWWD